MSTGITPAWAGKSDEEAMLNYDFKDHPRVGGEKKYVSHNDPGYLGSPPRGRGKGFCGRCQDVRPGITPAWAGKRQIHCAAEPMYRDHPRVGGEKRCFL